jgi:mxaJ protein
MRTWTLIVLMAIVAACSQKQHQQQQRPHSALSPQSSVLNQSSVLKVCADPNNMPFTNLHGQGFENRIADLIARDWNARVEYTWFPQRRGFARMTLKHGDCDVILGVPTNYEQAATTAPYYRSSYVFLSRRDRHLGITSLDDPRLHRLKIGIQIIGNDHVNAPPAHALAKRGIVANTVGYPVYGDYSKADPTRNIVDAVADGDVDLAVVWGPQAGWFARQQKVPLDIVPVSPQIDLPFLPLVFDISMGVRRGDTALKDRLDQELERRRADIERILDAYGVPRV